MRYFLGMEATRSKKDVIVSQQKYNLDLLIETGVLSYKPNETSTNAAFAVSIVSQHMHSLKEVNLEAKNKRKGVEIFNGADWAGSTEDRRSTTGYCTFVSENLITCRSKKQNIVKRSISEAEFREVALGLWIKKL
ncbi:uncharacterized protein LOC111383266 [Olea europaea var. sylvestris]|uniref:uncharacterized protein LOC111383266 n=1 Tax=Olea europaea var. sylvestris TaxID=158386 RepID=UPI000C1D39AE|nr:uncharacterized protein LOC111383266 [Olea europaea var. sylvestris]